MSDREVIQMIIAQLDKQDKKLDNITEKLNSFEVQASTILSTHEIEIKKHEKEIEDIKKKMELKTNDTEKIVGKIVNSPVFIFGFKIIMIVLASLILAGDKLKLVLGFLK